MRMIRPKSGRFAAGPFVIYASSRSQSITSTGIESNEVARTGGSPFAIGRPAPLARASLGNQNPETLLYSMTRFFRFLPDEHQQSFLENLRENES